MKVGVVGTSMADGILQRPGGDLRELEIPIIPVRERVAAFTRGKAPWPKNP
jgi:hypothetical protein